MHVDNHLPIPLVSTNLLPMINNQKVDVVNRQETFSHLSPSKSKWHKHAISFLNKKDQKLEQVLPNFNFQNKLDEIGKQIQKKFSPLTEFNQWLNESGKKEWYQELALFLVKLPIRVVRNITQLIYVIIKEACQTAVHPAKAALKLAKLIIGLVEALTQPETWSKIAAGVAGSSFGHMIAGNPLSLVGLLISGALLIGGLSFGALKSALEAEQGQELTAIKKELWQHVKQMPEAFLTGLCLGLMIGAIENHYIQQASYHLSQQQAQEIVKKFLNDNNWNQFYPDGQYVVSVDAHNNIIISIPNAPWNDIMLTTKGQTFAAASLTNLNQPNWYQLNYPDSSYYGVPELLQTQGTFETVTHSIGAISQIFKTAIE